MVKYLKHYDTIHQHWAVKIMKKVITTNMCGAKASGKLFQANIGEITARKWISY